MFTSQRPSPRRILSSALLLAAGSILIAAPVTAQPWQWDQRLNNNGLAGVVVETAIVFDDGTGPALYAGGGINNIDGLAAGGVIRWNGERWEPLPLLWGGSSRAWIYSMAIFDDGTGPALYVGGRVTGTSRGGQETLGIARWNGKSWQDVGGGITLESYGAHAGAVALHVHDDGTGPALYAAGPFDSAGGVTCYGLAKWDGIAWQALTGSDFMPGVLTPGVVQTAYALETFDADGDGPNPPELYIGGDLSGLVQRWNGVDFFEVGDIGNAFVPAVRSLRTFNGSFYAGAFYTSEVPGLHRWDGAAWSTPIADLLQNGRSLTVFDDGSGSALFFGAESYNGVLEPESAVVTWNGKSERRIGAGLQGNSQDLGGSFMVSAMVPLHDGEATRLHAVGVIANRPGVVKWDGEAWTPAFPAGEGGPDRGPVAADLDGDGPLPERLYAISHSGRFGSTVPDDYHSEFGQRYGWVGEFDGESWRVLGSFLGAALTSLQFIELNGSGALYATRGNELMRWNGDEWESVVTAGSDNMKLPASIFGVTSFDPDAAGPLPERLVVAGRFDTIAGKPARNIAQWNGKGWVPVGAGIGDASSSVDKLTVFNNTLCAGGRFLEAGGSLAVGVASWNGKAWSALGEGLSFGEFPTTIVTSMQAFTDADGPGLAIAGNFTAAGGVATPGIACWRSSGWSPFLEGFGSNTPTSPVFGMWDNGDGESLYVGGILGPATGPTGNRQRAAYVYKWSGTQWDVLTEGEGFKRPAVGAQTFSASISGIAAVGSGSSSSLYVTGFFGTVDGVRSSGIARLYSEQPACRADFNQDDALNSQDFFDFLQAFFDVHPSADFNRDDSINSQDFFDFLADFFAGC